MAEAKTLDQTSLKENNSTKIDVYVYKAKNDSGKIIKGEIQAVSLVQAKMILKKQGLLVQSVSKQRKSTLKGRNKKIKSKDITFFTRQMATMLAAGIPLVQSFDIVAKGLTHVELQKMIFSLKSQVEEGHTFMEALKKYPMYFNELYTSLISAGEQSGALEQILEKLAIQKEKMESIKGKIRKALFYPAAVIVIAVIVTIILLIFVVPQFEELFKGFGATLPVFTQMVIGLSRFAQKFWWIGLIGGGALGWGLNQALKRSENLKNNIERFSLKLPVVGPLLEKAAIAQFMRTLATTFAAGVPLVDGLQSVAKATGNIVFTDATLEISNDVAQGQSLQTSLRKTGLFPEMAIQMVTIGEESGALEQMLTKVADFYEEEVDNMVDSLSSLIEPLIIAALGLIVGSLVIAMYLPIFKLGSVV